MDTWYKGTKSQADACLKAINDNPVYPITGRNAATGELAPDKQKTICWADEVKECIDGEFAFPVPGTNTFEKLNIDEIAKEKLITDSKIVVKEFDKTWFPEPEIEAIK